MDEPPDKTAELEVFLAGAGDEVLSRARTPLSGMEAGVCQGCAPEARREEEGEAAARRAALLAEKGAGEERRRLALEAAELERARRKASAACLSCGRPTRRLGRTRCDACRSVNPEKSALKVRTMEAYGGGCSSCGCSILAFLCIDHIDRARPPGAPRTGPPLWAWLEARGWPKDCFRCLCGNCNQAHESYGYLLADGRPPEWDHEMLFGRIDSVRVAVRTRELCSRLEVLRAVSGLSITKFARAHGLSAGVATSVTRTASGWTPPPAAPRRTVMPRATPFTARVLRRIEAAFGMAGRLCRSCGEELPLAKFGAPRLKDVPDHCKLCRRARRLKDRLAAIDRYGGACACCGEKAFEFLVVDHVGGARPEGMPAFGVDLYRRLAAEPRRGGYRVLCHQCNSSYFVNGQRCPHEWIDPAMTLAEQAKVNLRVAVAVAVVRAEDRLVLDCLGDMVADGFADAPGSGVGAVARPLMCRHGENRVQVMSQ